jgi:hypothetical protein
MVTQILSSPFQMLYDADMGAADAAELQTIISSLREMLRSQTEEVSSLKKQLAATKTADPVRC